MKNKRFYILILAIILIFSSAVPTFAKKSDNIDYAKMLEDKDLNYLNNNIQEFREKHKNATDDDINKFLINEISNTPKKESITSTLSIDYSGAIPNNEDGTEKLNEQEKKLFNANPFKGITVLQNGSKAIKYTAKYWPNSKKVHDNADAFRHSIWNALMTSALGPTTAKEWADAHESQPDSADDPNARPMDLNNNQVGRNIGNKYWMTITVGDLEAKVVNDVLNSVKNGGMKRFVGGDIGYLTYLVATNSNDSLGPEQLPKSNVTYQVYVGGRWLPNVTNLNDYAGIYGQPIQAVYAHGDKSSIRLRVHVTGGNWLPWVTQRNDYAGIYGRNIDGLQVECLDGRRSARYRVYTAGRWLPWVNDLADYAGIYGNNISGIQIELINK